MTPEQELEELRKLQLDERKYVDFIERIGATGRVVDFLYSRIESRESQIEALQAALTEASRALHYRAGWRMEQQYSNA